MIVFYFEIIDPISKKKEYIRVARHLSMSNSEDPSGPKILYYRANRIWKLNTETDEIVWTKNRNLGLMSPIDKREFLVVQLSAKEHKSEYQI
jgi:hypothetical protein